MSGEDAVHLGTVLAWVVAYAVVAVGLVVVLSPRMRRLRTKLLLVIVAAVGAVAVGAVMAVSEMLLSPREMWLVVGVVAFAALVGAAGSFVTMRSVARPLERVSQAADRFAEGDLEARSGVSGPDEAGRLGAAFDSMAGSVERSWREKERRDLAHRTLVASISHDLRTPLASLRAMVEALRDGVVDDPATRSRYVALMLNQVEDLGALVDDLFQYSRLEAGDLELVREPVDVGDLVSDTVGQFSSAADARGVLIDAVVVGPLVATVGPREVQRVLANLVDNALRHTPDGGAIAIRAAADAGEIRVEVDDTGPGFADADLTRVFEAFHRGDPARSRATGGAGLGLAIARRLVEAHGGSVWADNARTGGAQVGFTIPF